MSRSRLHSLIGKSAALVVLGLAQACQTGAHQISSLPLDEGYHPRSVLSAAGIAMDDPVIPTHGWVRKRLAIGCGNNCKVNVWISAYSNSQGPDTANPPQTPLKIARVINLGHYKTEMYGLEARTQYDLVFRRDAAGRAEFVFEPLGSSLDESLKAKGGVDMCPGHRVAPRPEADFRGCDHVAPVMASTASMTGAPLTKVLRFFSASAATPAMAENAAWWGCGSGCCTARPVFQ